MSCDITADELLEEAKIILSYFPQPEFRNHKTHVVTNYKAFRGHTYKSSGTSSSKSKCKITQGPNIRIKGSARARRPVSQSKIYRSPSSGLLIDLGSGVTQTRSTNDFSDNNNSDNRPMSRERRRERRLIGQKRISPSSDWSEISTEVAVSAVPIPKQSGSRSKAFYNQESNGFPVSGSSAPTSLTDLEVKTSQVGLYQRKDDVQGNSKEKPARLDSVTTESQDGAESQSMGSSFLSTNRVTPPPKPGVPPPGYAASTVGPPPYANSVGTQPKSKETTCTSGSSTVKKTSAGCIPSKTNTDRFGFPDPSTGANTQFLQRLGELSGLESETIRFERMRGGGVSIPKTKRR